MKAIAIVLVLTCAMIVTTPALAADAPVRTEPCWYLDPTTVPPSVWADPQCVESQLSNAP